MSIQPQGAGSKKPWPEGTIEDWQNGASYGWLADKYGRSYSTVVKLIRRAKEMGTERVAHTTGRRRGGRVALALQKPLSYGHHSIGVRLNKYREIDHAYTYQQMADQISVNRLTVKKMELGLHDFTIRELQTLAIVMSTTVEELMKPFVKM
ncbi:MULTISPECIES: helix-turn-helix transcriptional regulator [unclassified Mesorhizobium]|uniref:helix-turn-helix domain-containing protein n=1 Tax=unclassified Mesorhizobium TaxID=325217 RepID=UPI000FD76EB9|nr:MULTISPECIES: helix-turn-helix transcriptional regulator [unclassified Mesorhizobium]TGT64140.1 XRE family transcriptional regulator [Mesorhizobium sp. M2E.F.Ca.ET.166.01.1.1]TGV96977.1 XRE family transcriptional regulator [Mesorhizobium sp. M2E.F.Ca.ET.154.01.1.1]